ncbi:MAG TPA: FAD-binding oxidoreductase, partial [Candidatus Norongarragalinales archaeon]|nr:FAD-binding oxidoreductase [Candidatus Norongarragalinales archaeon]
MLDTDLKIREIVQEAHNVKTISLDLDGKKFPFQPGQFVSVTVPTQEGPQIRSFSISSSPTTQDHLEITVKRYEDSSAAKALHAMKRGQTLHVRGPFGLFTLKPEDENVCMIAGGNGVTPLMSMIRYSSATKGTIHPLLLYSNRTKEDIIFYEELLDHEKKGTVDVFFTLTQESPAGWPGLSSRVDLD